MPSDRKLESRVQQPDLNRPDRLPSSREVLSSSRARAATSADVAVGQRMKKLRRAAGLTQKNLADLVGVTGAQLHRYEAGTTRVAASRLIDIAIALGVRAEVLIGGVSEPVAPSPSLRTIVETSNDLVMLVEIFSVITDPRRRKALIYFARTMAENEPDSP